MDGQNFENEQNVTVEQPAQENNYYQDNTTATPVAPVVEATPEKKADGLAIASLIVGILSIVLGCCITYLGIIGGIVGIVLAVLSKKNSGKSGMATAGMVCSIVAIVLAVIGIILALALGAAVATMDLSSFGY